MRSLILAIVTFFFLSACNENIGPSSDCEITATVIDMTGLDGCGFILQTDEGKKYEPLFIGWCGTPPYQEAPPDPLRGFTFRHGQRVKFSFEPTEMASICMTGEVVRITCINEIEAVQAD